MADFERGAGAAGLVLLAVAALFSTLYLVDPPTAEQVSASDPLVQLFHALAGWWSIPVLSILPGLLWFLAHGAKRRSGSGRNESVASRPAPGSLRGILLVAACAALLLSALRALYGPSLPPFIPPEESARPGMALGLGAALIEEGLFRLGLLAPLYVYGASRARPRQAAVAAVVVTSLALAAAHELGPGAGPFEVRFFATRLIVLGGLMGALFLRPGPPFLVAFHCSAHVGIPLLFNAAGAE